MPDICPPYFRAFSPPSTTGLSSVIDNIEKRFAGAGGGWDTINERTSLDVVRQHHEKSCVSAVGEMLTNGQVKQDFLIEKLLKYWPEEMREEEMEAAFEWLGMELREHHDSRWRAYAVTPESLEALIEKGPFGAELREPGAKYAHAVLIEGVDEFKNLKVLDPWDKGTRYEMTPEEFNEFWTLYVCYME